MPYRKRNASADDERVKSDHPPPENPALAANLKALRGTRSIEQLRQEMAEAGLPIGTETLHRAMLGKGGNRLSSLQKIAAFFGVTADQLLQPDLGVSGATWPFSEELYKKVSALKPQELQDLETAMRIHLHMDLQLDVINRTLAKYARAPGEEPGHGQEQLTKKS